MIDDSKRLDQNYLYSITVTLERERDDTSRETCSESTCSDKSDFMLYILKPFFCDLW